MGKKDQGRRARTKEFKAEAAVLAEKREKPISQIAVDLGASRSVPRRWTRQAREAERGG
jgi:transposase-like protein